ncbi:hypothetical protein B566_EDAN012219 [Ephemera danica]|nr:hypothetical protein B566_EDAN012219 [Ephemera danica]
MESLLLFLTVGVLYSNGYEWKPECWINGNLEISENEIYSCQNFSLAEEELKFCKFMFGNLQRLVLSSRNVTLQPVTCNDAIQLSNVNELKEKLSETVIKLQIAQQRELELDYRLEMSTMREMETKSLLEFTQEKEKELNERLELALIELADTKIKLGVIKIVQNNTEHLLQESNSKHSFAIQEKIKSTTQLRLENAILNETNFKCQQQRAHSIARIEKKTLESTSMKAKLESMEGFLNASRLQLHELQREHTEAVAKLREMNVTVKFMENDCNSKLECLGKEFQTNLTSLQSQLESLEGQTEKCECTTELMNDASVLPITETNEENIIEIPTTSVTPIYGLPEGAVNLTTGIYLFVNQRVTWSEGRAFCQEQGMDLVAIETEQENIVISNHAKSLGGQVGAIRVLKEDLCG